MKTAASSLLIAARFCSRLWTQLAPRSVDFILTDPPYITRYKARDGWTILNDDNAAGVAAPEALSSSLGSLDDQERLLVERAMQAAGGNQSQAARILRIRRDALRYKLKEHNLKVSMGSLAQLDAAFAQRCGDCL